MKKSVYVLWGIAAFAVLCAIVMVSKNIVGFCVYLAISILFIVLGFFRFRKSKAAPAPIAPETAPLPVLQQAALDRRNVCMLSDDKHIYLKTKIAGVTFKDGRKHRQDVLKSIYWGDYPFEEDKFHACTIKRGVYENNPSFAVLVHDSVIGYVPAEHVTYFYENFYRCDGIVFVYVLFAYDKFAARIITRFCKEDLEGISHDAPQEVIYHAAVLSASNRKIKLEMLK